MTEVHEPLAAMTPPAARAWPRWLLMAVIFMSGAIVGGVVSRIVTREQLLYMLKHPEHVPDQILPRLRSSLHLTDQQSRRMEEIVRRRLSAMESIRDQTHPAVLAEFHAMQSEVAELLLPDQRQRWTILSDSAEQRYLPSPPATKP